MKGLSGKLEDSMGEGDPRKKSMEKEVAGRGKSERSFRGGGSYQGWLGTQVGCPECHSHKQGMGGGSSHQLIERDLQGGGVNNGAGEAKGRSIPIAVGGDQSMKEENARAAHFSGTSP